MIEKLESAIDLGGSGWSSAWSRPTRDISNAITDFIGLGKAEISIHVSLVRILAVHQDIIKLFSKSSILDFKGSIFENAVTDDVEMRNIFKVAKVVSDDVMYGKMVIETKTHKVTIVALTR